MKNFSFAKLLEACLRGNSPTGLEREMSIEARLESREQGIALGAYAVPSAVLRSGLVESRDMTATGGTDGDEGGIAVQTDKLPIFDMLRAKLTLESLGATVMLGRVGNVTLPVQATDADPVAKAENAAAAEGSPTLLARAMTPHRVPIHIDVSRQLLYQPDHQVERWLRRNLAARLALSLEQFAINGTGADDQPLGILGTSGIGAVVGGTNGLAPTHDHIVDLEHQVALDDGEVGPAGYLTNPKVRSRLKRTRIDATSGINVWGPGNELNGYPVGVSTAVPSDLDKGTSEGVCSAIIYSGSWSDLWLVTWGGVEFMANPFSNDTTGIVKVTMVAFVDVAVARPACFSAMQDALTA